MLPAARAALAALVPLVGRVAVVSGRPAAFLAEHVAVDGVTYAGIYGLERWEGTPASGHVVVDPRVEEWAPIVAAVAAAADADLPGLLVERKGLVAVTLHWRTAPHREDEAEAWAAAVAAREGLTVVPGRLAAELRPPVPVDKGTTVADLARDASGALFAGDDAGDLPAFAGLRVLVARWRSGPRGHRRRAVRRVARRDRRRRTWWSTARRGWPNCWPRSRRRSARVVEQRGQPRLGRVARRGFAQ